METDVRTEELKIAMQNREFELSSFWQRSNYFLALVAALAVGVFTADDTFLQAIISIFAAVVSVLWFSTNLGSRYWQEFWEQEVTDLSKDLGIRSFAKPQSEINDQMRRNVKLTGLFFDKKVYDYLMLYKPSVTTNMIRLSALFIIFWIFAAVYFIMIGESEANSGIQFDLNWRIR